MSEPGFGEGCMFGGVKNLGKGWVCELVVVGVCVCSLVGCDDGLVEVGGDDACV